MMNLQNKIYPSKTESNTNTNPGISTQPTDSNPVVVVVATPSSSFLNSPLNILKDVDQLFFEESPTKDDLTKEYSIINESGQRLLYARHTYYFHEFQNREDSETAKLLRGIDIIDSNGQIIVTTSVITRVEDGCGGERPLIDFIINVHGKTAGRFNFDTCLHYPAPNEYDLQSNHDNINYKFVSKHYFHCCCPFWCCTCFPKPFEIYDKSNSKDLLGQIHRSWTNHPGLVGLQFPVSMSIKSKALLLVSGLYLNAQHFEKHGCWGHVGLVGETCSKMWAAIIGTLVLLIVIFLIILLSFKLSNKI